MNRNKWDEFGGGIDDVIQKAIDSGNYNSLGRDVNDLIRKAAYTVEDAINKGLNEAKNKAVKVNLGGNTVEINKNYQDRIKRPNKKNEAAPSDNKFYISDNKLMDQGMMGAIGGGATLFGLGTGFISTIFEGGDIVGTVVLATMLIPAAIWFLNGLDILKDRLIFKNYQKVIALSDSKSFAKIEDLMLETGETKKKTLKRLRKMIGKRWFKEGHIDKAETTFISTNETYALYQKTQLDFEERQRIEAELGAFKEEEKKTSNNAEVEETLNQGKKYLAQISHLNDRIPGIEVSNKIFKIENLTERILKRVEEHPSSAEDIKQLMKYYLPMTIKLLTAYAEMDEQQVKVDNIDKSKKEIENVLDSLNEAFNKLLDDLYKDTAWDIASDVSVLNAMLKREGLKGNDFSKAVDEGIKQTEKPADDKNKEEGIKLTL